MTPNKPLAGRRIVVTRAPEQSCELVSALEEKGANVVLLPLVAFAPPDDWRALDEQLQKLNGFDAILFLSRNAVRYLFKRCRELGITCDFSPSKGPLIATVGHATEDAAIREGLSVNYIAKGHTAESLARELRSFVANRTVLLPRGNRGDSELPDALREAGAYVTEVTAYRTVAPANPDPAILNSIRDAGVDSIVFASPSAYRNLCDLIPTSGLATVSARVQFVAIGPTTARAIRSSGARVAVEAAEPSAAAIAEALVEYFGSHEAKPRPA
jgi:uroporphyrinogen-III synthase